MVKQRNRRKSPILALLLAMILAFSFGGKTMATHACTITRGQARDLLLKAADDYQKNREMEPILRGYPDGSLEESQEVSRIEAIVMLGRAFGPLPAPGSHQTRIMEWNVTSEDIPDWAAADVNHLIQAGILTSEDLKSLQAPMTDIELERLIRRVWAFLGTNLKDDFYRTVNQEILDSAVFHPGYDSAGPWMDVADQNDRRIKAIIEEIVTSTPEVGSQGAAVKALYESIMDEEHRNAQGIAPIQTWLFAIDDAQCIRDLEMLRKEIITETGVPLIYGVALGQDVKDSTQSVLALYSPQASMEQGFYDEETEQNQKEAYITYRTALLKLAGYDEDTARAQAEAFYAYEAQLSKIQLRPEERYDADKTNHVLTLKELSMLLPSLDIKTLICGDGYQLEGTVTVGDINALEFFGKHYTDDQLPLAKAIFRFALLDAFSPMLQDEFTNAKLTFYNQRYGMSLSPMPLEERAAAVTKTLMSDYLGQQYVKRYCSAQVKEEVTALIKDILKVYEARIQKVDWLGAKTKQMAIKKLHSMHLMVAYPDDWSSPLDGIQLKSPQQGGTYFENYCTIIKTCRQAELQQQGKPVDQTAWHMPVYTVNAYYSCPDNTIVFPAGILQAPYYDSDASYETNLGAIGTIIAHEITHAFDNSGSKYDENGNVKNWWTEADAKAFEEKCRQVVSCYNEWESAPGLACNGTQTLGENIADIGGMACVLELAASSSEKPDYKALFYSNARIWASTQARALEEHQMEIDVHAPQNLRVNRVVAQFDVFYQVFDIDEDDGMYVPPEERIQIW